MKIVYSSYYRANKVAKMVGGKAKRIKHGELAGWYEVIA